LENLQSLDEVKMTRYFSTQTDFETLNSISLKSKKELILKLTFYFFLIFLIIGNGTIIGQSQEFRKTATSGFVFLEIPVDARTTALGESGIALSDLNSIGIFVNPAILGFTNKKHSASFSYTPYFAEIKQYGSSYLFNSDFGVVSVGAVVFDYGEMFKTQKVAGQRVYDVIGTFNPKSIALSAGYSRMLTDKFSFGVVLKYVSENIDVYNAKNIVIDGGIVYYTGLKSLRIAATLQNFGTNAKFINDPFKMPTVLKLGAAAEILGDYQSDYRITTLLSAIHPNDGDEKINTGIEVAWKNLFLIRGGYKFLYDEETYSFGFGINMEQLIPFSLDFSLSNYGRLGNILRLTLQAGI